MMAGVLEEILMSLFALDIDHYLFPTNCILVESNSVKRFKDAEWITIVMSFMFIIN